MTKLDIKATQCALETAQEELKDTAAVRSPTETMRW
jgi:hypothetical protein